MKNEKIILLLLIVVLGIFIFSKDITSHTEEKGIVLKLLKIIFEGVYKAKWIDYNKVLNFNVNFNGGDYEKII